jgi:hypothetical protein
MRKPGVKQEPGGQKLVVGGQQRACPVERADAAGGERAERPEPVLDSVERRQHVEPSQRSVALAELGDRLLGREETEAHSARRGGRERKVRFGRALGDDRELHGIVVPAVRTVRKGLRRLHSGSSPDGHSSDRLAP